MPEKNRDEDIPKTKNYDNNLVLIDDVTDPTKIPMFWGPTKDKFRENEPLNIPKMGRFIYSSALYNDIFFVWNNFG